MATAIKSTTKNGPNNSVEMRDKRAAAIAAMNLVTREGDRFKVGTPGLRNRQQFYEVWRDENAKVRCNCLEFEENIGSDAGFRCEHVLAVKHSLLAKSTEAATKQPAPNQPVVPLQTVTSPKFEVQSKNDEQITTDEEQNTQSEARVNDESERAEQELDQAKPQTTAVGRAAVLEAIEARKTLAKEARSKAQTVELADTQDKEETPMRKQNLKAASFAEVEKHNEQEVYESDNQAATQIAHVSNVVAMPFNQTLQALRERVEPGVVKQREGWRDRNGNVHMVDYVEWHTVADILDRVAPQWSHTIRDIKQIGDSIAVTAAITIDNVTREGIGTGAADTEMGIKKAEHDALKRAAVKFGIARELYRRESDVIEREGAATNNSNPNGGGFPSNPVARSLADLVTPKQLGMIRALGREAGVEIDEECQVVMSCKTDELSKKAASAFIQHLQDKQGQTQIEQAPASAATANANHNGLRRVG